jgi:hypothetical protein
MQAEGLGGGQAVLCGPVRYRQHRKVWEEAAGAATDVTSCRAAMLLVMLPTLQCTRGAWSPLQCPGTCEWQCLATTSCSCMQSTPSLEVLVNAAGTWTPHEVRRLTPKCDYLSGDVPKPTHAVVHNLPGN